MTTIVTEVAESPPTTLEEPSRSTALATSAIVSRAVLALAAVLAFAPVLGTPYSGDDVPNSGLPGFLAGHHISRWQNIADFMGLWMHFQGRFFPGAISESTFVFSTFTTRATYKGFLFVLILALLCATGWWVWRFMGDARLGFLSLIAIACCWQFRYTVFFDGLTSFSGLLPITVLIMLLALLCLRKRPSRYAWLALVGGSVLWAASIVTYEVAELLAPAAIASLWLVSSDARWRRSAVIAIAMPTLALAGIVAWLRVTLLPQPAPDFTVRIDGLVFVTTAKQFLAALPLSQYWIPNGTHPSTHLGALIWPVIGVAVVALIAGWHEWRSLQEVPRARIVLLLAIGIWIWVIPSLLVGVTERWQTQLAWGQGYLAVVFETLGVALVVIGLLCACHRLMKSNRLRMAGEATALAVIAALAFSLALTAGLNMSLIS